MATYGSTRDSYDRASSRTSHTSADTVDPLRRPPRVKRTRTISRSGPPVVRRVSHVSFSQTAIESWENDDTEEGDGDGDDEGPSPRDRKFIVITFSLVNFCLGTFYSLLGPFFPNEAVKKGMSVTTTGLVFGIFELFVVAMSPVFGNLITRIGAKFLYCSGIIVCGISAILFGFLDRCPDGAVYVVMCFIVRSVEGLGAAACITASFAIMANTFPKNVATMFGTLELFTGLGLMAGPPVGGALYQYGGYIMPFIVTGSLMASIGFLSIFLLPPIKDLQRSSGTLIISLLRIPLVTIMCFYLLVGAAAIGFIDVGLSLYLQEVYDFSPLIIGFMFLALPGAYAVVAPVWGVIADRKPQYNNVVLILGYVFGGLAFFLLGPAPFFKLQNNHLWLTILCLMVAGVGIGTLVTCFQVITAATTAAGFPETLDTYGLISGLFNSFFSLGVFIGPLLGGYLIDAFEFPTASVYVGGGMFLMVTVLSLYILIVKCQQRSRPQVDCDEKKRLTDSSLDSSEVLT